MFSIMELLKRQSQKYHMKLQLSGYLQLCKDPSSFVEIPFVVLKTPSEEKDKRPQHLKRHLNGLSINQVLGDMETILFHLVMTIERFLPK